MASPFINDSDLTKGRPMTALPRTVQGYCPMGHGQALTLDGDGRIKCSDSGCERPYAASEILADRETDHLVWFDAEGWWSARHPLRERLGGQMETCPLAVYLSSLSGDPMPAGTYRAILVGGSWTWGTPISPPGPDASPVPSDAGAGFLASPEDIPAVITGG